MCFGFPGLALTLAASAAPAEKTGMQAGDTKGWQPTPLSLLCVTSLGCPGHSTDLGVEVSAHGLLSPGLEVELSTALLFRITHHISHRLGGKQADRTTWFLLSVGLYPLPTSNPTRDAQVLIPSTCECDLIWK